MLRRLRGGLGLLHSEVFERQRRPGLERLNGNVAAYLTHDWQVEEFADQKALIVSEIGYHDLEEVIRLTGNEVARNDLGHRNDGLLELQRALVGMPVDLDAYKDGEAEPDALAPQGCPITFNVPLALQALDAAQTWRWRQTDLVGQFDVAQTPIGLQFGNNPAVGGIKIGFWHINEVFRLEKAHYCVFIADLSVFRKDMPSDRVPR